jgi:hypothetical protein
MQTFRQLGNRRLLRCAESGSVGRLVEKRVNADSSGCRGELKDGIAALGAA